MSCREYTIVLIPFQRILTKISHRLSQVRDVGGVSGNIGGVIGDIGGIRRHSIVGGFQLRAVNGIGAVSRQVAIFNVGDFAGGVGAMSCREYTIVLIPFQRIFIKVSHRLSQVRDVGGVSGNIGSVIGDIGGIRRHSIVGGFQLRAVNGISAASRQVAIFNVGDFAGCILVMSCTECIFSIIPQQGIILKVTNGIRQVGDIGGVGGNTCRIRGNVAGISSDIGGIGLDIVIGSFQLRTVNRIRTGSRNSAGFNVGDGAGGICTMCRTISLFNGVPLYRVIV